MALDPLEIRLRTFPIPLIDQRADGYHEVLVHDGLARRRLPVVPLPVDVPHGRAVDRVVAVGEDAHVAGARHGLEGALDGRELGALVGLEGALEGLGDVSVKCVSK